MFKINLTLLSKFELKKTNQLQTILWIATYNGIYYITFNILSKINLKQTEIVTNNTVVAKKMFSKKQNSPSYFLIKNNIISILIGNTLFFSKKLRIRGQRPKWSFQNDYLSARFLEISHTVKQLVPINTKIIYFEPSSKEARRKEVPIMLKHTNLWQLNNFVANFRKQYKPNFYTGKGIRYLKDTVSDRIARKELVKKSLRPIKKAKNKKKGKTTSKTVKTNISKQTK